MIDSMGETSDIGAGLKARDILSAPTLQCKCGCKVFKEAVIVKKISKLLTGSMTDTLYPIPVYVCNKCGEIAEEFLNKGNAKMILGEEESKSDLTI